jgi:hypothetical protein
MGIARTPATGGYAVRVAGRLDARWAGRFDGCTLHDGEDGTTVITGDAVDQAALHGVLLVLRDLGLPLLSVVPLDPDAPRALPPSRTSSVAATAQPTPRSTSCTA